MLCVPVTGRARLPGNQSNKNAIFLSHRPFSSNVALIKATAEVTAHK